MALRQAGGAYGRGEFRFSFNQRFVEQLVADVVQPVALTLVDRGVALAQSLVPVDTGALQRSISGEVRENPHSVTAVLSAGAPYAVFVELGTVKMDARPYLRPAADAIAAQLPGALRAESAAKGYR